MYQKNQLLEVEITDITNDGEGVGKLDGYTFFIKDALIGDRVQFIVTKVKKTYGYGKVKTVITASEHRVKAKCPDARRCGGCQIQELSYERQLKFKRDKVINNLIRLGGFEKEFLESVEEPIMGMKDDCFRYRNKAQFPIGYDKEGNLIAGFYAGRTHNIMPVDDCMIGASENKAILQAVLGWMKRYGISAYDEVLHKGIVRHVLIRKGFTSGELMVCLVVNADTLPKEKELVDCLLSVKEIQSISYSVNKEKTNVIMGDGYKTLYGSDTITDSIGNLEFKISPLSFYQVNPVQTRKLYEKALEYANLKGSESVWDLYCGIGTISLFLAKKAGHVYGVELVPQAIED
ncbi:MAG: 23S rRNA (uracil(1939)-C(5))-methyltransferase RlmD, partial [Lachnospiraceae bacterium]|nr:23S rRNA (uracil(1939)-C(5))-methyltransferase RlmD [Lachnospiraceae bacterium]